MTDYRLTDSERVSLLMAALTSLASRPGPPPSGLLDAIAKIQGTDTVLVAQRAYPPNYSEDAS